MMDLLDHLVMVVHLLQEVLVPVEKVQQEHQENLMVEILVL
jgi:hypothetical protein